MNPLKAEVVSVGYINGGDLGSLNIIPAEVHIGGRIQSFKPEMRDLLERRVDEMAKSMAAVFNSNADVHCRRGYTPSVNWTEQAEISLLATKEAVGEEKSFQTCNFYQAAKISLLC
jgi:hippurate hydrolase